MVIILQKKPKKSQILVDLVDKKLENLVDDGCLKAQDLVDE